MLVFMLQAYLFFKGRYPGGGDTPTLYPHGDLLDPSRLGGGSLTPATSSTPSAQYRSLSSIPGMVPGGLPLGADPRSPSSGVSPSASDPFTAQQLQSIGRPLSIPPTPSSDLRMLGIPQVGQRKESKQEEEARRASRRKKKE